MAIIFDKEWDSLSGFDNQLKSIRHYQLHPEMLPFIGRHYPNTKILILGESHYLSYKESSETKKLRDWYNRSTQDYAFKCAENFDTRGVVHNYLIGRRSKAYTMFRNPTMALIEGWRLKEVNDSEAFTGFAFFNYFQRPASDSGDSISLTPEDEEQAYSILTEIISILRPNKVIFLSKKSYDSYYGQVGEVDHDFIDFVYHPTSSYWNKENGRKKLCAIFSSMKRYNGFFTNGYLNRETASLVLSTSPYRLIQKGQRRFYSGIVTYQIYTDRNDTSSVSEVAWYLADGNKRFGIGFVIKTRILWAWDYVDKCYVKEEEIESYPKLLELYQNALHIISLL